MKSLLGLLEPEEFVGKLWHRAVHGDARPRFPEAASRLEDARRSLGVVFRGLGGAAALSIVGIGAGESGHRTSRRERFSSASAAPTARRDSQALYLPAVVDLWPDRADNQALHLWLAAFFAHLPPRPPETPGPARDLAILRSVARATDQALAAAPGLRPVYAKLSEMVLSARAARAAARGGGSRTRSSRPACPRRACICARVRRRACGGSVNGLPPVRAGPALGRGDRHRGRRGAGCCRR